DGIRDFHVTGVQTCALPISLATTPKDDRPRIAAGRARALVGLEPDALIGDVCGLLEDHGIKVFTPELASEGFFGLSIAGREGGQIGRASCRERVEVSVVAGE